MYKDEPWMNIEESWMYIQETPMGSIQ